MSENLQETALPIKPEIRPRTPDEILAHGDAMVRFTLAIIIGLAIATLTFGGIFVWFKDPQYSRELWVIIGPIISGAIQGAIGFLAGQHHRASRKKHR